MVDAVRAMLGRRSAHATPVTRSRLLMAVVLALVGGTWVLQGLGLIAGKSFMVGDPMWAVLGFALIAVAGLYLVWPTLRRPR